MRPAAGALAAAAARVGRWGVVAWIAFSLLAVADRYLVGNCGPGSSFGGSCSAPGLGHYYELLSAATVAGLVLVPTALVKAAQERPSYAQRAAIRQPAALAPPRLA